jgi:alkanesulfonate monooxygenase SsuD/methylene tetrahydromethanopterin reductase-like flavin-dependent oxidoreductase (luciferase family)
MADLLFGLDLSSASTQGEPIAIAQQAEAAGFDFVSANDHPGLPTSTWEVWTLLTWVAASTTRLRVASRVLGVPYRVPALVAKMAETLGRLSEGRLILGLGAGSGDDEFRAFGLPVPSPREKVDGLEDALMIIRGLWSERTYTYHGSRYGTDAAELEPKPEREIPIWVGTIGPRGVELTGRIADGWIPSYAYAPPERALALRDRVRFAAERAGRDPDSVRCVYNVEVHVGSREASDASKITGSTDEITEFLLELVRSGFGGFNFIIESPSAENERMLLAKQVLPVLRDS